MYGSYRKMFDTLNTPNSPITETQVFAPSVQSHSSGSPQQSTVPSPDWRINTREEFQEACRVGFFEYMEQRDPEFQRARRQMQELNSLHAITYSSADPLPQRFTQDQTEKCPVMPNMRR